MLLDQEIVLVFMRFFVIYIIVGILIMIMAGLVNHISSLHKRLRIQVTEHFNLINRMREGVLVFVKHSPNPLHHQT